MARLEFDGSRLHRYGGLKRQRSGTKQPIETQYNWWLSERDKKDLFGSNLKLSPSIPILVFPPRDQTRKVNRGTHTVGSFIHSVIVAAITIDIDSMSHPDIISSGQF